MSDPQNPVDPQQPPAYQPPAYQPPQQYPGAGDAGSGYAAAPPAPYGPPATPTVPGRTMGIVAFILSFFVQLVALILGIIALVQSKKAGHSNGWAVAAIIISSVLMVIGIIVAVTAVVFALYAWLALGSVLAAWLIPVILFIGGVGAFVRTYHLWQIEDSGWLAWQGAGWFLLMLMLICLSVPGAAMMSS